MTDVPGDTPNSEAWRVPAALRIGKDIVEIEVNPPTVTSLDLNPRPMVSYPVLPLPVLQYAKERDCEWMWERLRPENGSHPSAEVLGCTESVYVPVEADAGCCLRVTCTPTAAAPSGVRRGNAFTATAGTRVQTAPSG